jgi:hypothetical protein
LRDFLGDSGQLSFFRENPLTAISAAFIFVVVVGNKKQTHRLSQWDATVTLEADRVIFHAAGGGKSPINTEYAQGLHAVVGALFEVGLGFEVEVVSRTAMASFTRRKRVIGAWKFGDGGEGVNLFDPHAVLRQVDVVRREICRGAAKCGRPKGARGNGNGRKRIALIVGPDKMTKAAQAVLRIVEEEKR